MAAILKKMKWLVKVNASVFTPKATRIQDKTQTDGNPHSVPPGRVSHKNDAAPHSLKLRPETREEQILDFTSHETIFDSLLVRTRSKL